MKRENLLIVGAILLLGCSSGVESGEEHFFAHHPISYDAGPWVNEWDTPTGYHCISTKYGYSGGLQCFKVQP
jgi:hypothetical protein